MYRKFARKISIPQIVKAARANVFFLTVFWTVMFILFLVIMVYQLTLLGITLKDNNKIFNIRLKTQIPMKFPAVTVCNMNPYKLSAMQNLPEWIALLNVTVEMAKFNHTNQTSTQSIRKKRLTPAYIPIPIINGIQWLNSSTGQLYHYHQDNSLNWNQSAQFCESMQSTLPIFHSPAEENSFHSLMQSVLQSVNYTEWSHIGLHEKSDNKSWIWMDNTSPTYYNWITIVPQPDDDGPCSDRSGSHYGFKWNDNDCEANLSFSCQIIPKTSPSYYSWLLSSTGQYYFTVPNIDLIWTEAVEYCAQLGATLPIFRSAAEESAYHDLTNSIDGNVSAGFRFLGLQKWTGSWMWLDNTYPTYFNWYTPNNEPTGDGNCSTMYNLYFDYEWNDYSCLKNYSSSFSCQLNQSRCPIPILGKSYNLLNQHFGCLLDISDENSIIINRQNYSSNSQQWYIVKVPFTSNYAILNSNNHLALDTTGNVTQQNLTCNINQQFMFVYGSQCDLYIRSAADNSVLTAMNQGSDCSNPNSSVVTTPNVNAKRQKWSFVELAAASVWQTISAKCPVTTSTTMAATSTQLTTIVTTPTCSLPVEGKVYQLINKNFNCAMDDYHGLKTPGNYIVTYFNWNQANTFLQQWYVGKVPGTSNYVILSANSDLALDISGTVTQQNLTCNLNQQFTLETDSQCNFFIQSVSGNKTVLTENGQAADCKKVAVIENQINLNISQQKWSFVEVVNTTWTPVYAVCPCSVPVEGKVYNLINKNFHCAMDIYYALKNVGNNISSYQFWNFDATWQQWYFGKVPGTSNYVILNAYSDLALDMTGNVATQQNLTCNSNQQFTFDYDSQCNFFIQSLSNSNTVLTEIGQFANCSNHLSILESQQNLNSSQQKWSFVEAINTTWTPVYVNCPVTSTVFLDSSTTDSSTSATSSTTAATTTDVATVQGALITTLDLIKILSIENINPGATISQYSIIQNALPFLMSALTEAQRSQLGYQLSDVLSFCSFEGVMCDTKKDIVQWNDETVGNCFTFNHNKSINQRYSSEPGCDLGLKMLFKVSQNEYLPTVLSTALKIFIHDQNRVIFPDNEGFSSSPAFKAEFGMKYEETNRMDYCVSSPSEKDYFYVGDYSNEGCIRTCYQKIVVKNCGCGDPRFGLLTDSVHFQRYCEIKEYPCVSQLQNVSFDELLANDTDCSCIAMPCNEKLLLPSTYTEEDRKDSVLIEVYYQSFNYILYEEVEVYTVVQFLSDFGALGGIYLGCSFITAFELMLLFTFIVFGRDAFGK